jgi:hypothetical protein
LLAAAALRAYRHVSPREPVPPPPPNAPEGTWDEDAAYLEWEHWQTLADVGALLEIEAFSNSRGLVEKPMQIHIVSGGGIQVEEYRRDFGAQHLEKVDNVIGDPDVGTPAPNGPANPSPPADDDAEG